MGASNSVEREIKKTLSRASREGDIEALSETLKLNESSLLINEYGPKGTPLYEAASSNQVEAARLLLEHGARVNMQDQNNGWTALHVACKKNCYDMVKLLIEAKGVDLNITTRDELKQTPLHLAAHLCSKEIVKCLLDNGANKSLTDTFGSTPDKWTKNPDIKTLILNHHKGDKPAASTPTDSSNVLNGKYEILERIGKGGFGVVYKVRITQSGIDSDVRAVKVVTFDDEMEMENANREATAMLSLDNPYVLKTYEIFRYEPTKGLCFCMEYYSHGDLDSYIRKFGSSTIPKQIVFAVFYQMAKALSYLHERRLIHRDIKPQNIFVKNLGEKVINIVLGDFGLSKQIDNTQNQTKAGTLLFMSPEVFSNEPYGLKADIWSLGVVLYQLMTKEMDTNICAHLLTKGATGVQTVKEKLSQKGFYPSQLVDLVMQTLSVDHELRPSASDLCTNLLDIKDACESEGFSIKSFLNRDE